MRTRILLTVAATSLAISAACADSEEQPLPERETPPPSTLDAEVPDATAPDVDAPDTSLPKCSAAGWCITAFPDADLDFIDIWPFEDRAFAIAQSRVEKIKILEWQKATDTWQYIDDKTQNEVGVGTFAARIYAPSEDEIYFTVEPAFVFHGKRPAAPETGWRWSRQRLPDNIVGHPSTHDHTRYQSSGLANQVTLGVWGTGADDVYAHYSNTIFRRNTINDTWETAYEASDLGANDHIFFTAVASAGPEDLWFVGGRAISGESCPLAVRKTADGFTRVADGIAQGVFNNKCAPRAGTPRIGNGGGGWLVDVQPSSAGEVLALYTGYKPDLYAIDGVKLTAMRIEDGGLAYEQSLVPVKISQAQPLKVMSSLLHLDGENWFTSWGLVLHGTADNTFTVSTISRDGAPVDGPMHRIRGTSKTNLWAIGARHAYHKTTP